MRTFEFRKAVRERTPLIIGLAGQSGTGKSFSAMRLATGMVKVFGGRIAVVDTEARRALHYADRFDFDHVDFTPPFGPLDYMAAIDTAVKSGASVVIVDSMTHEHSGQGGVMDQIDAFLDQKCGDDWGKREKMNMVAHARIKPQRKELNNYLVQVGRTGVVLILCYRAHDKVKPVAPRDRVNGEAMKHIGFTPETTSPLVYEMTQCYLLKPGADGKPTTKPDTDEERVLTKTPIQFKGWSTGDQIDEQLGEKLARWAAGSGQTTASIEDRRASAIKAFEDFGLSPYQVHWILNLTLDDDLTDAHLKVLRGHLSSLRKGLITTESLLHGMVKPPEPEDQSQATDDDLHEADAGSQG